MDDELRIANLRIAQDARAALMSFLGGDRQASRNELRKLTLYAHGKGEITLDDVMAVVADASELKLDPIVDGAFAGRPDIVETEFAKAMIAGTYPGMIISAAQRQAAWLHKSALAIADGTPASAVLEGGLSAAAFFAKARGRNRAAQFQRGAARRNHRAARDRRARHPQAIHARRRHRPAHADGDRRECEAAGMSSIAVAWSAAPISFRETRRSDDALETLLRFASRLITSSS